MIVMEELTAVELCCVVQGGVVDINVMDNIHLYFSFLLEGRIQDSRSSLSYAQQLQEVVAGNEILKSQAPSNNRKNV